MSTLRKVVSAATPATPQMPIASRYEAAARSAARAKDILGTATPLRLRQERSLSTCGELASNVERWRDLRESLDSSETARRVLGERFAGHTTRREVLVSSAAHVRTVQAAGSAAADTRLAATRGFKESIFAAAGHRRSCAGCGRHDHFSDRSV